MLGGGGYYYGCIGYHILSCTKVVCYIPVAVRCRAGPDSAPAARLCGFPVAAVLQALLVDQAGCGDEDGVGPSQLPDQARAFCSFCVCKCLLKAHAPAPQPPPPPLMLVLCLPQGRASVVRPAAVAALLRSAPQAVPFARRVDLLRALLAHDARTHGFNRPVYEGGAPPIQVWVV